MTDNFPQKQEWGARGKRLLPGQSVNLAQSGGRRLQPSPLFWREPRAPVLLFFTFALLLVGGAIGV